jgi:hypothetical protein
LATLKSSFPKDHFARIIADMQNSKSWQDAIVQYYNYLDGIGGTATISVGGSSVRRHRALFEAFNYDNPEMKMSSDLDKSRPKAANERFEIPAIPLPLGDHYVTSLKQGIGSNIPRPELRFVSPITPVSDETLARDQKLHAISVLLQRLLVNKLKNGSDNNAMRLLDRVQEEGMTKGTGGLRLSKWQSSHGEPPELMIDFIPYESILLSASGRYLAIKLEVFKGSSDAKQYTFKTEGDWKDDESDEACRSYWEFYDIDERITYYLDEEGEYQVKKAEYWPIGLDSPPIVLFSTGRSFEGSPYLSGLIERWLPIWEELVIATSMLCYYSKESSKAKLLASSAFANDNEFLNDINDAEKWLIPLKFMPDPTSGDFLDKHLIPYKPIQSIAEWQNWLQELRRMLAEYQYFPDVSRGVGGNQVAYMKAGTAQTVDQTRARVVGEVALAFSNMLERLYRAMLDFLGANPDIGAVREFFKDEYGGVDEATIAMLRKDVDINVSIVDINLTPEQQDAQRMMAMTQGAPAILQTIQALQMTLQQMQKQLDTAQLANDLFEKLFGLPINKYIKPLPSLPPQIGGGMGAEQPATQGVAPEGVAPEGQASTSASWLNNFLYERGFQDIVVALNSVPPELAEQLGMIAQTLYSGENAEERIMDFIEALVSALGAGDVVGELSSIVQQYQRLVS